MADPVQTMSPRQKALQNLSNQLPVANAKVAAGQQAARDMQLQQAVAKAPVGANTTQAAQQTGAAAATSAGAQMVDAAQNQVKQQGQIGAVGLADQQAQAQSNVAGLRQGARQQELDNVQKFAQVSEAAKQEMFDKQMNFTKDEQGRTFFNERQLADFARLTADNDEQFKDYAQNAEQLNKRKLQSMEHAYKITMQDLQQKQNLAEQKKDQQAQLQINQIRKEIEEKMQRERARAANRAAAWQAGGMIVGAAAGAFVGGPAGAMAGAQLGGAAGGMAASQTKA